MLPNWYQRHILPTALNLACGMPMISRMRHNNKQQVTNITGLDPALQMHPLALPGLTWQPSNAQRDLKPQFGYNKPHYGYY